MMSTLRIWKMRLDSVMSLEHSTNCWKPLRAVSATAWSEKTSANAKKSHRLGNQQPVTDSTCWFNDYPVAGSRAKQLEMWRLLKGARYSLSYAETYRRVPSSDGTRNITDIPFYTTPSIILHDFIVRKGLATQFGKKKVNGFEKKAA